MSIRSALKQRFASVAVVGLLCSGAAITVVSPSANAVVGGGLFTAITPVRALDTRQSTPILAGETRHLVVAGLFGIPATASAVALNLTAVSPTSDSYLTIWPMGLARPDTSSLNVGAGQVRPNAVIVQLNNGGIDIFNFAGSTHALVDVNGWFSSGATADGGFVGLAPTRLLDTRTGIGRNGTAPVPAGASFNLQVGGRGGVPTSGVSAVVLNVTGTSPTATTYVTVWPSGGVLPGVSSLNLVTGETAANMVMVPVSVTGMVSLYNQLGSVHLIADVMGYFTAGTPGPGGFVPVAPVRVFDSRSLTSIPGRGWRAVKAGGVGSIPASGVGAIAANFTVTGPTADSFLSAFPTAAGTSTTGFVPSVALPNASNLNFLAGQTVPNAAVVAVGPEASVWTYNYSGRTHLIVDVSGYWIGTTPAGNTPPAPATGPGAGGTARGTTSSGQALFWDTCGPIPWYVDPANGTGKGLDDVISAMERITVRTGLPLVFGGFTAAPEPSVVEAAYSNANRALFIRWRSSVQDTALAGSTIALARTYFYNYGEIFSSLVTLRTDSTSYTEGFGPGQSWGGVLLHEIGHSMGLEHTSDAVQIMYPTISNAQDEYGAGDLTGLAATKRAGCFLKPADGVKEYAERP